MIIIDILDESIPFRHNCRMRGLVISPEQCRAARALLNWSQRELADRAGIGIVTLRQLEAGVNEPRRATLEVVKRALESAGVSFICENGGGAGVRLTKPKMGRASSTRTSED